jgi:hypothetical protein
MGSDVRGRATGRLNGSDRGKTTPDVQATRTQPAPRKRQRQPGEGAHTIPRQIQCNQNEVVDAPATFEASQAAWKDERYHRTAGMVGRT